MELFTFEQIFGAIGAFFAFFVFAPIVGLWEYIIRRF